MTHLFPRISIITPCMNGAQFVRYAIESVLGQDYKNYEHIVVDGGSTDGTLDILRRYKHLSFISEPDQNLYDAINKGIGIAKGDIIGHLNADDSYSPNIFGKIVSIFQRHPDIDAVCGKASVFEKDEPSHSFKTEAIYQDNLSFENITLNAPIINAKFFRKSLYDRVGNYDVNFAIAADREFLLRVAVNGIKSVAFNEIAYNYRRHNNSLTFGTLSIQQKKRTKIDCLKISESYLENYEGTKEIQNLLRKWHTKISADLLVLYLREKRLKEALSTVRRGIKYDLRFPLSFALWAAQSRRIQGN